MGNFEQTKIVLVDNNEQMRTSIKQQMNGEEVKIVADFSDAISALNYIKDNEVDVIITDIVLPNIDGYEFMEAINKQGLANKPKILVLSALSNDNFINKALQYGADYYMIKPCDVNLLKQRVNELKNTPIMVEKQNNDIKSVKPRNRQLEEKITNIFIKNAIIFISIFSIQATIFFYS